MSARDALFWDIWDNRTAEEKNALINAYRDEVALEIGRDALRDGLIPTLTRLVGDANATKLMADFRDAFAHELAEKQRAAAKTEFDRDIYIDELSMRFTNKVIDVIDPESEGP
jgi:hypothetical protein